MTTSLTHRDNDIDYIDSNDYVEYLKYQGYLVKGEYVFKKSKSYVPQSIEIIKRYFPGGICIHNETEISKLKDIATKIFGNIDYPEKVRAISARLNDNLILCGRGMFIHPDNVKIDYSLLDEIKDYIRNKESDSLLYHEIFEVFRNRLVERTNIDNRHYLHGVLKYLYTEEFHYGRDEIQKIDGNGISIGERISTFIINKGSFVTADEIRKEFPGLTDAIIFNAIITVKGLIQWEYKKYNHINNIILSSSEIEQIYQQLNKLIDRNIGYTSENIIYKKCNQKMHEVLMKNGIRSSMNLFYVLDNMFGKKYTFKRPHIAGSNLDYFDLNMKNLILKTSIKNGVFSYSRFKRKGDEFGWSPATMHMLNSNLIKDLFRISDDEYIFHEEISLEQNMKNKITESIDSLFPKVGYKSLFSIYDYSSFPNFEYEWNDFLLESIINTFDLGYRIVYPEVTDRRYQRGIIVRKDSLITSLADVVLNIINDKELSSITAEKLEYILQMSGVISGGLPYELKELYSY